MLYAQYLYHSKQYDCCIQITWNKQHSASEPVYSYLHTKCCEDLLRRGLIKEFTANEAKNLVRILSIVKLY